MRHGVTESNQTAFGLADIVEFRIGAFDISKIENTDFVYIHDVGDRLKDGEILDLWGRPYHIAFDLDGDDLITLRAMSTVRAPFLIWSDGENGVNEFGERDDVKNWRDGAIYTGRSSQRSGEIIP